MTTVFNLQPPSNWRADEIADQLAEQFIDCETIDHNSETADGLAAINPSDFDSSAAIGQTWKI